MATQHFSPPKRAFPIPLPDSVQTLESIETDWSYRKKGTTTWYYAGGSSGNTIYLVNSTPIANPFSNTKNLYHTVLHYACKTEGITAQNAIFNAVWDHFKGPANVTNLAGDQLYYYEPGIQVETTDSLTNTVDLLQTRNAQCLGWVDFFKDTIRVHGLKSATVDVVAEGALSDVGMVIGNWNTNNFGTSGNPNYPYELTFHDPNRIDMVPNYNNGNYGDLLSLSTHKGQNTAPPAQKIFSVHQVVKWGSSFEPYYDPSYGRRYSRGSNFEWEVVDGYYSNVHTQGTNIVVDVRQAPYQGDISFDIRPEN